MTSQAGSFFFDFSIRDLVRKNRYWAPRIQEDLMRGVGIAGGAGGVSGRGGAGAGSVSRQESFTFSLYGAGGEEFDGAKFIESLRADVEAEITGVGLAITAGDSFGSVGFSLDYSAGELKGRIQIIGRITLDGNNYHIAASLEEKGAAGNAALWRQRHSLHQPKGNYYVVTFPDDDIRAHSQRFYYRGKEALDTSRERIRRLCTTDPSRGKSLIKALPHAEVYVWRPIPADIKDQLGRIGRHVDVPAEYDQHSIVYFLNEVALTMYREAGEQFEILKTVSEDDMYRIPGPQLRGPYLAEEP